MFIWTFVLAKPNIPVDPEYSIFGFCLDVLTPIDQFVDQVIDKLLKGILNRSFIALFFSIPQAFSDYRSAWVTLS